MTVSWVCIVVNNHASPDQNSIANLRVSQSELKSLCFGDVALVRVE